MLAVELFEELEGPPEPTLIDALRDFLPIAVRYLKLKHIPKIKLLRDVDTEHLPSFGKFSNEDRIVHVDVENRHPNDVLRTLAHELTHYAQGEQDRLDADSWRTGSTIEDEANAEAGVIMREFNQQFPQYMELKPIILPEAWSQKYKKSINCNNPKGFSQRAHCQGRKKNNEAVEPHEPGYQHSLLTMPANTLVIDTPGELDWYKIGQHFPNLGKEDPHEYGQSESDMVINFANPEEMSKFADIAKRLGLKIKSIGGTQEHPEIHAEPKLENFADGKGPGRPGDSQRHGIPKGATMAQLEKAARAPGRKGQLARWQINMRRGRKK